jgi:2-hydroxychromene-2-carboxylate isomerase
MAVPAKGAYMGRELERWAKRYGVPFAANPFPFRSNTLRLMRGATASQRLDTFEPYHRAVFDAAWGNQQDLGDDAVFQRLLVGAGIDPQRLLPAIDEEDTKTALRRTTDEAVERGVFGAPTFFVGQEMFWGNDRLDWVEQALQRAAR